MLYGIMAETRREMYERLDRHAEKTDKAVSDIHSGISDIKEMLADGQEKFGRVDERLKTEKDEREKLTRRVDDVESDVSKIPKPGTSKTKDDSGANRTKPPTDLRIRMVNAFILAAVGAAGTAVGIWLTSMHNAPKENQAQTTKTPP